MSTRLEDHARTDVLSIAVNSRSLIANRDDLIRDMQGRGLNVAAELVPVVTALGRGLRPRSRRRSRESSSEVCLGR